MLGWLMGDSHPRDYPQGGGVCRGSPMQPTPIQEEMVVGSPPDPPSTGEGGSHAPPPQPPLRGEGWVAKEPYHYPRRGLPLQPPLVIFFLFLFLFFRDS
jgi:hypothetical protein